MREMLATTAALYGQGMGSKVALGRTSLTMLLSIIRLRLIYSPLHPLLRRFRPVEAWIYRKLKALGLPVGRREES